MEICLQDSLNSTSTFLYQPRFSPSVTKKDYINWCIPKYFLHILCVGSAALPAGASVECEIYSSPQWRYGGVWDLELQKKKHAVESGVCCSRRRSCGIVCVLQFSPKEQRQSVGSAELPALAAVECYSVGSAALPAGAAVECGICSSVRRSCGRVCDLQRSPQELRQSVGSTTLPARAAVECGICSSLRRSSFRVWDLQL